MSQEQNNFKKSQLVYLFGVLWLQDGGPLAGISVCTFSRSTLSTQVLNIVQIKILGPDWRNPLWHLRDAILPVAYSCPSSISDLVGLVYCISPFARLRGWQPTTKKTNSYMNKFSAFSRDVLQLCSLNVFFWVKSHDFSKELRDLRESSLLIGWETRSHDKLRDFTSRRSHF